MKTYIFYRISRQIYYKIAWLLQHFNRNFGAHGCLLSLNKRKIMETQKNYVIMMLYQQITFFLELPGTFTS